MRRQPRSLLLLGCVPTLFLVANALSVVSQEVPETPGQVALARLKSAQSVKAEPLVVRVGISEYQRSDYLYKRWVGLFEDLSLLSEPTLKQPVRFQVAIGTYDEVIQWQDRGQIDLAVLSAKAVADLLMLSNAQDKAALDRTYLGSVAYYSEPDPKYDSVLNFYSLDEQRLRKRGEYYRSTCVVNAKSSIRSLEDLARASKLPGTRLKFLFVRPYSVSGNVHPRAVLKLLDIPITDYEYTYQHDNSLTYLLDPRPEDRDKELVAFVLDTAPFPIEHKPELRKIDIHELEEVKIPQEALFLNSKFINDDTFRQRKNMLLALLRARNQVAHCSRTGTAAQTCFVERNESEYSWANKYQLIVEELQKAKLPTKLEARLTVDDFIEELNLFRVPNKTLRVPRTPELTDLKPARRM